MNMSKLKNHGTRKILSLTLAAVMLLGMAFTGIPAGILTAHAGMDESYIDANGQEQICPFAANLGSGTTTLTSGWYLASGTLNYTSTITVSGDVYLILKDGCNLTVTGGSGSAGINVAAGNSLTIYAQSGGTGSLTATGGGSSYGSGAGIGGGGGFLSQGEDGGTITINGGTVTATGGSSTDVNYSGGGGAGIGGGGGHNNAGGAGGTIIINGGTVSATGGNGTAAGGGAGIGGGGGSLGGASGYIYITGNADVTAVGGSVLLFNGSAQSGGAGIGSGGSRSNGKAGDVNSITIDTTGTVVATGGNGGNSNTNTMLGGSGGAGIGTGGTGSAGEGALGDIIVLSADVTATGGSGGTNNSGNSGSDGASIGFGGGGANSGAEIPIIKITTQPASITFIEGSISGSLTAAASVSQSGTPSYEWFSNTSNSNSGGTSIGVTTAGFIIPTDLTVQGSPYYYYCEISATGATTVRTGVATVTVIDKTALTALISTANSTKNGATVGAGNGQYTQTVYDTFASAITAAEAVANGTPTTQVAVDNAVIALQSAITTFNGAANVVNADELTALIATATQKKNNSTYGDKNGDYPASAKTALEAAVTAAQTVADKSDRTPAEVTQAISDLQTAINNFNQTLVVVNYTALNDLISLCNPLHDNAAEGDGNGQYESGSKAVFKAAIETAEGVATNNRATQAEVDQAVSDLTAARDTFASKKIGVNYDVLNGLIAQAQDKAQNSVYGDKNGDYPASAKTALEAAVAAAQTVADNNTATQAAVNAAVSELEAAITAFNNAKIAVNYQNLKDLIETAKNAKGEAFPGNGNGQTPQAAIDVLGAAIDAAKLIADNDYLSQYTVNTAFSDLTAALSDFYAAKISVNTPELEKAIEDAEKLNESDYTEDSWKNLQDAIDNAKKILDKENVTQAELDAAAKAVTDAINALVQKPTDPSDPTDPTDPANPTDPSAPGTGDNSNPFIPLALMAVSMGGIVLTVKRRKRGSVEG